VKKVASRAYFLLALSFDISQKAELFTTAAVNNTYPREPSLVTQNMF
jgi:hypothetical protein